MKKQLIKTKSIAEQLSSFRSKEYMELYFEMIEFFNSYFDSQALEYIKSLDTYPNIKLNKSEEDFQEFINKLLSIFFLWQVEANDKILTDLYRVWYWSEWYETITNEFALEWAEEQAWKSMALINETTSNAINSIITEWIKNSNSLKEIASQIKEKFADYTIYRSTLIATQEIATAYSQWEKKQYDIYSEELWVTWFKRSVTQKDSNVRESHKHNEDEWWIPRDKVYPWTWTMNAPHWFLCRCHDVNSMTNPDTGLLYDSDIEYNENQFENFSNNWWWLDELNIDLSIKEKELAASYDLLPEEIFSIKTFSWEWYKKYNDWYLKASSDLMFQSWIPFFMWWLNKLPKYEWKVFRWHKVSKKVYDSYLNFNEWDVFSYNTFFSSSKSKNVAKKFIWDKNKVLFDINTKKWISIEDFSFKPGEKEVLFLPNTLFRIDKVEKKDDILIINLIDL